MKGEEKSLIISCDKNRTSIKTGTRVADIVMPPQKCAQEFCVDESFSFYIQTKRLFESESKVV